MVDVYDFETYVASGRTLMQFNCPKCSKQIAIYMQAESRDKFQKIIGGLGGRIVVP